MDKYKTVGHRFVATIIDLLLMLPVAFVSSIIKSSAESPFAVTFFTYFTGIIYIVYVIQMHTLYGQTIGKMAVNIKVLDISEKPILFGQAILRSLPQVALIMFFLAFSAGEAAEDEFTNLIFAVLFWFLLFFFGAVDIVTLLANNRHCALRDFIAGTIVIRTDV